MEVAIGVMIVAFASEYIDATLGMGYGTTLTPVLLLFGFRPLQVVPSVLLSQFVSGITAAFFHHRFGNVDFSRGEKYLRIALVLAACGVVAALAAVFIAVSLPQTILRAYIGGVVLAIGVVILVTLRSHYRFSWGKVFGLGLVAALNKGISGGGYGPIVTGGQLLSGIEEKNAIGVTALAEGLVCIVATVAYIFAGSKTDWILAPYLVVGAILSAPLSVITVRRIETKKLRMMIGIITVVLGAITLIKVFV